MLPGRCPYCTYFITFALQLRDKRQHINRIIGFFLLCVFSIALTPWSSLHHHEEEEENCVEYGKVCMHKVHVSRQAHNCLICSAHFEKDYHTSPVLYKVILESKAADESNGAKTSAAYTILIGSSLRGPPLA